MKRILFTITTLILAAGFAFAHPHPGGGGGGGIVEHEEGLAVGAEFAWNHINEGSDAWDRTLSINVNYGHAFFNEALTLDLGVSYTLGFESMQFIRDGRLQETLPHALNIDLLVGQHHRFSDTSKASIFLQHEFEEIRFPFNAYQDEEAIVNGNLEIHTANNFDARFTLTLGYEHTSAIGDSIFQIGFPVKYASHNRYANTEIGMRFVYGLRTNFGLDVEAGIELLFQPELPWEKDAGFDSLSFNFMWEIDPLVRGRDITLTPGLELNIPLSRLGQVRNFDELGMAITPSLELVLRGHWTIALGVEIDHIGSQTESVSVSPTIGLTFGW